MSAANIENAEEQDDDPTNSSENLTSSSCSSDASTTTTSSVSSSTISDTSSMSSASSTTDNEMDNGDGLVHHHRHCPKSVGPSCSEIDYHTCDIGDVRNNHLGPINHDRGISRLESPIGQKCDAPRAAPNNCLSISKTEIPPGSASEVMQEKKCCHAMVPTKSASALVVNQASHNSRCQQSTSNNLLNVVQQKRDDQHPDRCHATSLGSSYSNLTCSNTEEPASNGAQSRRSLKPAPSPSPSMSTIDTNNNKGNDASNATRGEGLTSTKRTNFSKSASGSRLVSRSRPNVCDCLSQDCEEKKHSNRRQFIEQYYNSRTQLSTGNTSTSSFNISTPLNRLSECDAITKRLLSSPIRATPNLIESPVHRIQKSEVDKSRRASLGTNTITDQVFLFASSPFKYLESSYRARTENQRKFDPDGAKSSDERDAKLKQQGRSLSVCDEETLNPRTRNTNLNYTSNLNRTISLACESGTSSSARRSLTIIPLFGCDIKSLEQFTKFGLILPPVIDSAVEHILVNGINSIGIFRKSGVKSRILTLKQKIETDQNITIDELNQNNEFSIYDIADLVKMWFRELRPLPLMTREIIKLVTTFLNTTSHVPQVTFIKRGLSSQQDTRPTSSSRSNITTVKHIDPSLKSKIDTMIAPAHRALLFRALNFLAQISSKCGSNQMTSQNLAICLTPSLCATESDQSSILLAQKALEFCIDNHRSLFGRASE